MRVCVYTCRRCWCKCGIPSPWQPIPEPRRKLSPKWDYTQREVWCDEGVFISALSLSPFSATHNLTSTCTRLLTTLTALNSNCMTLDLGVVLQWRFAALRTVGSCSHLDKTTLLNVVGIHWRGSPSSQLSRDRHHRWTDNGQVLISPWPTCSDLMWFCSMMEFEKKKQRNIWWSRATASDMGVP